MSAARTPGPWQVTSPIRKNSRKPTIATADRIPYAIATVCGGIGEGAREANAAFIVRACNAHDDLVAAAKRVLSSQWASIDYEHNRTPEACDVRAQLIAALAKVTP